ncbi:deglycase PfpI [Pyrococcus abyssi]|uniref:Deglycase PYRAB04690 n=1 Tax=Pyrococcus abyssi (strain GE5 / Orsay) TaxID=272844 RepID=DEGLY_PYRAB|nr:deglycase PfpI [Pyrococcus abyssi]Q9V1F8.1 RecName: Full=Deglycase PYRAB04690; AltName: Full=Intracellular protease PYRAB04690 [Pyrococcus abyssi GE5]CAB49391.1 pfpI intracellular protease. protease I [Pyrococcus abyssi GE5]CCE69852.1 TPA: intracellular protease [Pyrococcus abyssi GE5]
MRVLILSADQFEDVELIYPYHRLKEEGHEVLVASFKRGVITGKHGYTVNVDLAFEEVNPDEFDALVLPGGRAPERVRLNEKAVEIAKKMFSEGKPVASICHGPQILISAGVLRGRRGTSYPGIKDDMINAGVDWVDAEVVVDGNWVSSRVPGDLYAWMREFVKLLK